MASEPRAVVRFDATERVLHLIHATAFFALLFTGLVLYLPFLALEVSNRPLMKAVHLASAAAWLTALVLVAVLGDRRSLRRTRREIERFGVEDLRWLRRRGDGSAGRFNAGQKAHTVIHAALAVLFTVSGTLLWLGERNTALRLPGTIALHDVAMYVAGALVAGHLYLAFSPTMRPALKAIMRGDVPVEWAAEHHPRWSPDRAPAPRAHPRKRAIALALVVALVGAAGATLLVTDVLGGAPGPGTIQR